MKHEVQVSLNKRLVAVRSGRFWAALLCNGQNARNQSTTFRGEDAANNSRLSFFKQRLFATQEIRKLRNMAAETIEGHWTNDGTLE